MNETEQKRSNVLENMRKSIENNVRYSSQDTCAKLEIDQEISNLIQQIGYVLDENKHPSLRTDVIMGEVKQTLNPILKTKEHLEQKSEGFIQIVNQRLNKVTETLVRSGNDEQQLKEKMGEFKRTVISEYDSQNNEDEITENQIYDNKITEKEIKIDRQNFTTQSTPLYYNLKDELSRMGIDNEDMINEIVRNVENTVVDIYSRWDIGKRHQDKDMSDILDEAIQEAQNQFISINEQELNTKGNDFFGSLKAGVKDPEEINERKPDENNKKISRDDNMSK